jgi:hypothetical protein
MESRLILISIYIAIAVVSAVLIAVHLMQMDWAITYNLITVPMVGLSNPVAITNLVVVALQLLTLSILWQAHQSIALRA